MNLKELLAQTRADIKERQAQITAKRAELRSAIEKAQTPEELDATKAIRSKIEDIEKEIAEKEDYARSLEEAIKGIQDPAPKKRTGNTVAELRENLANYIRTRDAVSAGFKSTDGSAIIPKDIIYQPEMEVKTVTDLSKLVRLVNTNFASGTYPILKRSTAKMHTVEELTQNPDLAKPQVVNVDYKIETYRGSIPVSQEAIDDSTPDLLNLVGQNALDQEVNTKNDLISAQLKTFTAKEITDLDSLKAIFNVNLDPGYAKGIVASQTFYNWLDTLKDGNGQYVLKPAVAEGSPNTIFGVPVVTVEDTLLGNAGEAHAFVGDLTRAVALFLRKDLQLRWVDNNIYGQYLGMFLRMDVVKADENAGFFATVNSLK